MVWLGSVLYETWAKAFSCWQAGSQALVKPHASPITFPWRSRLLLQHVTPMTSLQTRRFLLF